MSIVVSCPCGKQLRARDELAGRKAKCPGCGAILRIPEKPFDPEEDIFDLVDPPSAAAPATTTAPSTAPAIVARSAPPAMPRAVLPALTRSSDAASFKSQTILYVLLALALLPLAWTTFHKDDVENRIEQTLRANPNLEQRLAASPDEASLFSALPQHRFQGALLAHDSMAHWAIALLSAALVFSAIVLVFPPGTANFPRLLAIGASTATFGIVFLFGVQWAAQWTQGRIIYGRSVIVVIFYILKFIGFSYRAALDPDTNFFVSFVGFTFGVGLCEELCKAIPLLVHYKTKAELPWRAACMWGLISGVGFGVSEGIMYSADHYNGVYGIDIYLVRFISCVALHAAWTGAAAIFIYKQQALLNSSESIWGALGTSVVLVSVPMILHGLYDTLLKKDHDVASLIVALISFAWLGWQIETAKRVYDQQEHPRTRAALA